MLNWNNIYWRIASRREVLAELSAGDPSECIASENAIREFARAVPENDMSDDWRPSGLEIGHTRGMPLFRWLAGLERGSAAHDRRNDELEDFTRQYIEKAVCRSVSFFTWGMLARLFPRWMKCLIWCLSMPINGIFGILSLGI